MDLQLVASYFTVKSMDGIAVQLRTFYTSDTYFPDFSWILLDLSGSFSFLLEVYHPALFIYSTVKHIYLAVT